MKQNSESFVPEYRWMYPHEERYHLLNKYILFFALCGHSLFIPVFYLLNRNIPFYNNLACVAIDLLCLYLNHKWKPKIVYILFILEITYHTFFCNIYFGWRAGFIFYFFTLTFYIFLFRKYKHLRAVLFSIVTFSFILQYFYLESSATQYPDTVIPVWLIYFFNAAANFSAIVFIASEFSLFVDTTESTMLKAREKAEEGERAKSVFLANMSHEIRSPLNSIIGMINLSLISDLNDDKKKFLYIAKNSADHLLTVINDILDYSRIEVNRLKLDEQVFDIYHLLKNTMMAMDSSIYNRNLNMKYNIAEDVPKIVQGDPSRLRQVLINLISNAIKFTERGSITVSVSKIQGDNETAILKFSVEDTGKGIQEDKLGSIFNRFMQIPGNESVKFTGTGLGLAISKELVELMGGTIEVESTPGFGSTFTFQVPLGIADNDESVSCTPSDISERRPGISLHVLIAEDIFTNWLLYEKYMQILGHSFKIVENGNMVLDELERNLYDIILMDIEMPEMNGDETLKLIRSGARGSNKEIPVIAMTGYTINDLKKSDCSFTGYLIKPVELDDLEQKINEIMFQPQNI